MPIKKLLCLGDSLTEGYNIDVSKRWTELLKKSTGHDIINCGISGDTTNGMLARLQQTVDVHQPSHLFFMGGTNDLWMDIPDELILGNILAVTRQARFQKIQVIIGIIPPVYANATEDIDPPIFLDNERLATRVRHFQGKLRQFVQRDDWPFLDLSNLSPSLFLADGVHLNESGQVEIAKLFEQVIRLINTH